MEISTLILILILIGVVLISLTSVDWSKENRNNAKSLKGRYYEQKVAQTISKLSTEYIVFNDLLFASNGRSTQIDHIIVSPYGVFVIETKGHKGCIFGGENTQYWTQILYRKRYHFYSPIKQNEGHIRCLQYLLKSSIDIPFISIVTFNDNAMLSVNTTDQNVVNISELMWTILQYKTPVLDKTTINRIVNTIQNNSVIADKKALENHINYVRKQSH